MTALGSEVSDGNRGVLLRTYNVPNDVPNKFTNFKIWEAARATSAAPIFFKRLEKDGKKFIDGGLGFNNPIHQ
jgi:patatin-like phospholipase/acyl hydrolase